MSATVEDRLCHVYRNRRFTGVLEGIDGEADAEAFRFVYPPSQTAMKIEEPSDLLGEGEEMIEVEVCGRPMERIGDTDFWYCPECDRRYPPQL